jgi:hypothetical protein
VPLPQAELPLGGAGGLKLISRAPAKANSQQQVLDLHRQSTHTNSGCVMNRVGSGIIFEVAK